MHTPIRKKSFQPCGTPIPLTPNVRQSMQCTHLCDVEEQEGHHEREKTSGLSEGETENGVLEELTPEGGVAGDTLDETPENRSDTDTGTSKANGGETGTLDLGGGNHGGSGGLDDDATLLDDVAGGVVAEGTAGRDERGLGGLADGCEMRVNGGTMTHGRAWWRGSAGGHAAGAHTSVGEAAGGHAGGAEGAGDGNHCEGGDDRRGDDLEMN